ncbi:hypothetical protein [Burkholderia anthina]|nr:hypothetical protein [Burkholderia anthina]
MSTTDHSKAQSCRAYIAARPDIEVSEGIAEEGYRRLENDYNVEHCNKL